MRKLMPKDEFDFADPMELNGVGLVCDEDTSELMTDCFVEEFMRLGHNHKQILALFRNPHYLGMNMVLQNRGEEFVRNKITEVFSRWGRPVSWPSAQSHATHAPEQLIEIDEGAADPMGAAIPKLKL